MDSRNLWQDCDTSLASSSERSGVCRIDNFHLDVPAHSLITRRKCRDFLALKLELDGLAPELDLSPTLLLDLKSEDLDEVPSLSKKAAWAEPTSEDSGSVQSDGHPLATLFSFSSDASRAPCAALGARDADYSIPLEWYGKTIVMLNRLNQECDQSMVKRALDSSIFRDTYDFLYVPMKPKSHMNQGFCFINFVTSDLTFSFKREIERFNTTTPGVKQLVVTYAKLQGIEANYRHFKDSAVMSGKLSNRPLFLVPRKGAHALDEVWYESCNHSARRRHVAKTSLLEA
eukprot:TRINITY_DN48330_c0_g1_i1.p1 TRINITY_DN48330_c0_g1~~TRINITY_DN48330_c0_g1_i1.p1  ORF type:complete len:305 (-),score=31.57 TRINITY_DN48330_c0_g1_i1:108-968(-)